MAAAFTPAAPWWPFPSVSVSVSKTDEPEERVDQDPPDPEPEGVEAQQAIAEAVAKLQAIRARPAVTLSSRRELRAVVRAAIGELRRFVWGLDVSRDEITAMEITAAVAKGGRGVPIATLDGWHLESRRLENNIRVFKRAAFEERHRVYLKKPRYRSRLRRKRARRS